MKTKKSFRSCPSEIQIISAAFEASQDHIIITDENANIIYANKAVEENTGFSLAEVIGNNPSVLWGGPYARRVLCENVAYH